MPGIRGYDYGTTRAARSPITLDELRELEATVGWTADDDQAIVMAGEVLGARKRQWSIADARSSVTTRFWQDGFAAPTANRTRPTRPLSRSALCNGCPICAGASETKSGSIIRRRSGSATHRRRKIRLKKHIRRTWCHCATFGPSPGSSSAARENSSRAKAAPPRRSSACTKPGRRACC
jgi:hypothetical protein